MENCLGEKIKDVISVCDREADVYEYIQYKLEHKQRFIVIGAERQRMQSPNNLEKMVVILSFLAVRLLQLKEYLEPSSLALEEDAVCTPCNELLTEIEWKVLWKTVEKKELPSKPPTAEWAYQAIAKLGGWGNSKRTGKASWATLWDGWFRLTERVEGFLLAQTL